MANTTNLDQANPEEGGSYDTWGDILDANRQIVDKAAGSTATITDASGSITLTQDQSNHAVLKFTATLTGNLTVNTLAGKSRYWQVYNDTSGAYSITFQVTGGAGASVVAPQGKWCLINTDGTDCRIISLATLGGDLAANQVAISKLAQIANLKVLGNVSGSAGNVSEVTVSNDAALADGSQTELVTEYAVKTFVNNKVPGTITVSTSNPTGGNNGDLWFRVLP
jgi:hypothetical protein